MHESIGITSLDPRTKLLGVVMLLVTTFLVERISCLLGLSALFVVSAVVTKMSMTTYVKHLTLLSWLLLVTFFLHVWANDTSHTSNMFFSHGVIKGLMAVGQLSVAVGWITILNSISSPLELMNGFERLLHPLQRLGFQNRHISIIGMLSIRFLPIVFEEGQYLVQAYIARGIELNRGTVATRLRNALLLCVPLVGMMMRRVDHIACAMENRGFYVGVVRSSLQEFRFRIVDYLVLGGIWGLMIGCYVLNRT